jgi:hypothetical protein
MNFFYELLLTLHNLWRWVALVLAILAAVTALIGWFGKRPWTERDRKTGSFTAMAMDIQFLLGLLLYIFGEFGIKGLSKGMDFVTANKDYRFFGLEHLFYMLLVVILAHVGSILPRKAQEPAKKFMRAAIPFTLMVLLIIIGIPWWRPLLRIFGFTLP